MIDYIYVWVSFVIALSKKYQDPKKLVRHSCKLLAIFLLLTAFLLSFAWLWGYHVTLTREKFDEMITCIVFSYALGASLGWSLNTALKEYIESITDEETGITSTTEV